MCGFEEIARLRRRLLNNRKYMYMYTYMYVYVRDVLITVL